MSTWLDETKVRCGAATAGPWEATDAWDPVSEGARAWPRWEVTAPLRRDPETACATRPVIPFSAADAEFIAHARVDLPRALALIDELAETLRSLRDEMANGFPSHRADCSSEQYRRVGPTGAQTYRFVTIEADCTCYVAGVRAAPAELDAG